MNDPGFPHDPLRFADVTYTQGLRAVARLHHDFQERLQRTRNEATTRKQLVDHIFFDALGWHEEDSTLEERLVNGSYTDYTFTLTRPHFIVEAKREGVYFDIPVADRQGDIALGALKRGNDRLRAAIEQVTAYCVSRGVQYAVVTNGHQLVAFAAFRSDGLSPDEGKCFVIRSPGELEDNFLSAWNLLSRTAAGQNSFRQFFFGIEPPRTPAKLARDISDYPGVKARNAFQADLQAVSELVLEDLVRNREVEPEFLRECYCETGALAQYSLNARDILKARYDALFTASEPGPAAVPLSAKENQLKNIGPLTPRPVLLIGDVGVGKTTFVKHLLLTDDEVVQRKSIILYVDLGTTLTITEDMRSSMITELQGQLYDEYEVDLGEDSFVRGVYHFELQRFNASIYKRLKESDPDAYRKREINFLAEKIEQQDRHLAASLKHLVLAQRRQVLIIIDNCDQRSEADQEQAFLIAQEMASSWPCSVFIALRPETFHASRRRGALTGYHAKAFTIAPPRLDQVIARRLYFALKITRGEAPLSDRFAAGSVRFETLSALIEVVLRSLRWSDDLISCIENMSGGNVRLALDLIRGFFGSGHVNTHKIVQIYRESGNYVIPLHEFVRAIIYGDNIHYSPSDSIIANVFDVHSIDEKDHFLALLILGALNTLRDKSSAERGFVKTADVYQVLRSLGYSDDQLDSSLAPLVAKKLVETAARRVPGPGQAPSAALRITSIGLYHLMVLPKMFPYVEAMIVDTPIFDADSRRKLAIPQQTLEERLQRVQYFGSYLDRAWALLPESAVALFDWKSISSGLRAELDRVQRQKTRFSRSVASKSANRGRENT